MDKINDKTIFYRVKLSETVLDVARKFNACVFDVIEKNRLVKDVRAGDIIMVNSSPINTLYKVGVTENAYTISQKLKISEDTLKMNNGGIPYVFYGLEIKV